MAVYLRDKAERLRRTWEDADSLRVDELFELNGELSPASQREIRTEMMKQVTNKPNVIIRQMVK
jgi:hypothetical protein